MPVPLPHQRHTTVKAGRLQTDRTTAGVDRRRVLGLLATAASASVLMGCAGVTDPRVHGTNPNTPPPVPSPDPAVVRAANEVASLRALVARLPASVSKPWGDGVAAMLDAHLAVLGSRHPLSGRQTPQPWFSPTDSTSLATSPSVATPTASTPAEYEQAATALAAAHAARAQDELEPGLAMLWGSLSVATTLHRVPGPVPVPGSAPHDVDVVDEATARNVLLGYLHSLAQVLQLGIGVTDGDARAAYQSRWDQVRVLVISQQGLIRSLGADPAGPLPGYDLPGPTDSPQGIAATTTLVEQQVFTASAPVIAASPAAGRPQAIADMVTQGTVVHARGASTPYFPGWA